VLAEFYERSTADLSPEVRPFIEDNLALVGATESPRIHLQAHAASVLLLLGITRSGC